MGKIAIDKNWQTLDLLSIIMAIEKKTMRRQQVRYRLFRIREEKEEFNHGLKEFIENQFKSGMTWSNFTFDWDVAPNNPLKVISPFEWTSLGGKMQIIDDKTMLCDPTGFTNQCMCESYPCVHHGERHGGTK